MEKTKLIFWGIVVCMINVSLLGYYRGFDSGYETAFSLSKECLGFTISGSDDSLFKTHLYLAACAFLFVVAKWFEKNLFLRVLSVSSLILALVLYLRWLGLLITNTELTLRENFGHSVSVFDLISFALVIVLILLEARSLLRR
jgi:hypothetical protein